MSVCVAVSGMLWKEIMWPGRSLSLGLGVPVRAGVGVDRGGAELRRIAEDCGGG
jgi:hypothetical protein